MTKEQKKIAKAYITEIKNELPCSRTEKSVFISMFKKRIIEQFEDKSDTTYDELVSILGTPESIANMFDVTEYAEKAKIKKQKAVLYCVIVTILIAALTITIIALIDATSDTYVTVTNDFLNKKIIF